VATEAYLSTAHQRVSVRRHARLLDYRMHDGCNARTWVFVEVPAGGPQVLKPGTRVLSGSAGAHSPMVPEATLDDLVAREAPIVFETVAAVTLRHAHNVIPFHTWSDLGCCLPVGSMRATLRNDAGLTLRSGDYLLLEEVKGPSGASQDANPHHRQVVRLTSVVTTTGSGGGATPLTDPVDGTPIAEVEWALDDALTFPLCISTVGADGTVIASDLSVARGNVVPADHGFTTSWPLEPPEAPHGEAYRPSVAGAPLSCRGPWDLQGPASRAFAQSPRKALPVVALTGDAAVWKPQPDLLASNRFAHDVAVET